MNPLKSSMLPGLFAWCLGMMWLSPLNAADQPFYQNNFEQAALDDVPEDFLILDGFFAVKQDGDNRLLELPGAPLGTFGILFASNVVDGVKVSARIFGTNTKRRYPAFGVGLNGLAGYRLMVTPAKRKVELFKGELEVASIKHKWKPGTWTEFRLQTRKTGESEWRVEGKVWVEGTKEPETWILQYSETKEPFAGKASIWGKPFSGTPIRYDDLVVSPAMP